MAVNDPTTNYGWILPDSGADVGTWGNLLNAVFGEDTGPPLGIDGVLKNLEDMFASLDADNLIQGTVPDARLSGSYTGITDITLSGSLTAGNASFGNELVVDTSSDVLSSGNNNNLVVGDTTYVRLTSASGGSTLTGVAGGVDGRMLLFRRVGANALTITHNDTASTAANRFQFPTGFDLPLAQDQAAMFVYDGSLNRWVLA